MKSKKDFTQTTAPALNRSPVMQFIGEAAELPQEPQKAPQSIDTPEQGKTVERKTQRVNLLFYPSVWREIQRIAEAEDRSGNDIMNALAKEFIEKHKGQ